MNWARVSQSRRSSWHIVGRADLTRCGRRVVGEQVPSFPDDEKSCESCLRLAAKDSQ